MQDSLLQRLVSGLADVPGLQAIVLGGSRARGTATAKSDYDLGLYYAAASPLDTDELLRAVRDLVEEPEKTKVTAVGAWGPWIVGGAWLSIDGRKVDLLYRDIEAVERVIHMCRAGHVSMDYQPGHPHGFCSAIWMGEIALCRPLHDPTGAIGELKALAFPYPEPLRRALIQRFEWEILFSAENGDIALSRADQNHVAGCAYRALGCIAQVLFALNSRYLNNEKAALQEAATFPLTIPNLTERVTELWRLIGVGELSSALAGLRAFEAELKQLTKNV
jgi:Nucleotidyltransferase domain